MKIITKKSEKSLIEEFVDHFKKDILKKSRKNKRISLVLTGGKSPIKLYRKLSESKIDWKKIDLFWGDERYVSHKSNNSNFKLVFNEIIKKIKINKKNIYPVYTNKKIENSANDYSNKIKKYFRYKKISFDYFLLGMGKDGHIVSIFPDDKKYKKTIIAYSVNRNDFKRITLNLDIINNSKKIFLWLNNKSKTKKYEQLKKLGNQIPVNNLKKRNILIYKVK
tara:strand:- start:377 stop:1042 length:666 start_codon:yes stop_codon:yes gene_type:complete